MLCNVWDPRAHRLSAVTLHATANCALWHQPDGRAAQEIFFSSGRTCRRASGVRARDCIVHAVQGACRTTHVCVQTRFDALLNALGPGKCQLYSEDINQRGEPCPPDLRWSTKHVLHGTLGLAVLLMLAVASGMELLGGMRSKRHGRRGVCARAARGGVH